MRRSLAILCSLTLGGCFFTHDPGGDAGSSDGEAGPVRDGAPSSDGAFGTECPDLGGYRTCGARCAADCPEEDGCRQYIDVCLPFGEIYGCNVTLEATDSDYPNRGYCPDGQVCFVADEVHEAAASLVGPCVSEEFCRELPGTTIEGRCYWSDESRFEDGSPVLDACPERSARRVEFCGGPCGPCVMERWRSRYRNGGSCIGLSERRAFGVCTFNGNHPCSRDDPGITIHCASDWDEPCACLLMELPDGSFNEIGYPTLQSACLDYQAHFPDTVRCMDPETWVPLER